MSLLSHAADSPADTPAETPVDQMIEVASRLLGENGYIVNPGVYKGWAVGPTSQYDALGYMAFRLPQ